MIRKFSTAISCGVVFAALSMSAVAFAAPGDPGTGAAACQPEQGEITSAVAQTGQLGGIISSLAPINQLNQQSLFDCRQP